MRRVCHPYWMECAGLAALLAVILLFAWLPVPMPPGSDIAFARTVLRGMTMGRLNGAVPAVPRIQISAWQRLAEPGDVLVFHNPHCAYGYWSHAVLYAGGGWVIDATDFVRGTTLRPLSVFQYYEKAALLRPAVPAAVRRQSARIAQAYVGRMYDPFAPLSDDRRQYCSKLVWTAYRRAGVTLCPPKAWIVPDDLYQSRLLQVVAKAGGPAGDGAAGPKEG
ncbi:hypothetical protein GCM10010885_04520 [Alicyclobacillus cellulosilyticus]|uniref:Permuted papain-like amidase YaeF/Yiix C92 family enzyme n=1 Tax=Alicyclobacillus cellulosilyticus TaxID=1003997 RepID=A0A917K3X8_9BACL|nr:YiiX/YebB-like N1pC/P60 family cysteine hydrolase [Alicyclobacillus cellulosilyticus]GGI98007.1 hypothetical protein GCM10010885_04520 [Alicyclobacillus cellulosilyticus]